MLIGWVNRKANGEEYRRKEEESAEGKTVRCTNIEGWKRNTVDSREGDTGMKFCNRLPIVFQWAPCKFSNNAAESELCPVISVECLLPVLGVEVGWRCPQENYPNLILNH